MRGVTRAERLKACTSHRRREIVRSPGVQFIVPELIGADREPERNPILARSETTWSPALENSRPHLEQAIA